MENYLVRASALGGFHAAVEELGGDAAEILRRVGLDDDIEQDTEAWLSYHKFLLLLEEAAQATGCSHFGLHLSQHQGINILGPVGFVIQHAPDLRTALVELTTFFSQHNQGANVSLKLEDGIARWSFNCKLEGYASTWQQVDLAASIGLNMVRTLWHPTWSPDVAYFPHGQPRDLRPYRKIFNCPMIFDWDSLMVTFDADTLDSPIIQANPELHRVLQQHLSLLQLSYPNDYCGQVRHLIRQALAVGDCAIDRVAAHLAVNKRTLQRELKAHNTSYQNLLDEVRSDIARQYLLQSNGSLTALAEMLCYSDLSTFSTAFRQLNGLSPSDWKKRQQLADVADSGLT
tara:strand:+ start:108761 stop:109792 length:1032 start_codon:yes stop_codon:yes gene_type:complete